MGAAARPICSADCAARLDHASRFEARGQPRRSALLEHAEAYGAVPHARHSACCCEFRTRRYCPPVRAPACAPYVLSMFQESASPRLPASFNRLAVVQSRRAVGGADRSGRRAHRGRARAGRRRGGDGTVADRADAAVSPALDPRGCARRSRLAPPAHGGGRGAARALARRRPDARAPEPIDAAAARAAGASSARAGRWRTAWPAPALVPALVPAGALAAANGRIELARTVAFAGGPALAGALVGWTGGAPAFGVAAGLSAAAVVLLAGVREPARPLIAGRRVLHDLRDGARFVFGHPLLRPVFLTQLVFNTAFFMLQAVLRAVRRPSSRPLRVRPSGRRWPRTASAWSSARC